MVIINFLAGKRLSRLCSSSSIGFIQQSWRYSGKWEAAAMAATKAAQPHVTPDCVCVYERQNSAHDDTNCTLFEARGLSTASRGLNVQVDGPWTVSV